MSEVEEIIYLRHFSNGVHLCYCCDGIFKVFPDKQSTTIDYNGCDVARRYRAGGNTSDNGREFKTIDNGGGYYIVKCPGYKRMNDKALYKAYIQTGTWRKTARRRMEIDGFKCQMCGTGKNLVVHHITYDHLGCEDMDDLVTVCKSCHEKIHSEDIGAKKK